MASVTLPAPGRGAPLSLRVTAPDSGASLPVILFSHGAQLNELDYQPLVDFWAANGFVVIQPTHLDGLAAKLPPSNPHTRTIWRSRVEDLKRVLDELDRIEAKTPGLGGRLDRSRIAAVGHSYGGHTVEALLGARPADPANGRRVDLMDRRVKVGVLLSPPGDGGRGGSNLTPAWAPRTAYLDVSFATMATPTLVIVGDLDVSPMSRLGAAWHADPYILGPAGRCLWTMALVGHWLGGIGGAERSPTDNDPGRVAAVARASLAYLRSVLYPGDPAQSQVRAPRPEWLAPGDRFECK